MESNFVSVCLSTVVGAHLREDDHFNVSLADPSVDCNAFGHEM